MQAAKEYPPKYLFDKGDLMKAFVVAVKTEVEGCKVCHDSQNKPALEFHHRDPREKVSSIGGMLRNPTKYTLTDLMNEVAKCDLLCTDCHKDVHKQWQKATGKPNRNPLFEPFLVKIPANDRK